VLEGVLDARSAKYEAAFRSSLANLSAVFGFLTHQVVNTRAALEFVCTLHALVVENVKSMGVPPASAVKHLFFFFFAYMQDSIQAHACATHANTMHKHCTRAHLDHNAFNAIQRKHNCTTPHTLSLGAQPTQVDGNNALLGLHRCAGGIPLREVGTVRVEDQEEQREGLVDEHVCLPVATDSFVQCAKSHRDCSTVPHSSILMGRISSVTSPFSTFDASKLADCDRHTCRCCTECTHTFLFLQ